jgi:hypothetical protein
VVVLAKFGWRRVAIEEDVGMRWAEGRAGTARLTMGCSRAGGGRMPSRGEGESGGELGMSMADRRRTGDTDGDSSLLSAPMSLPLSTLACLLDGAPLSGGPKPLGGRARGLEGRPVA